MLVLPGRAFGPYVPQVFLPAMAAVRRGAELVALEWDDDVPSTEMPTMVAQVEARVRPVLTGLDPGRTLVVAKSLGTCAARLLVEAALPLVLVTPLLRAAEVVEPLRAARAPVLLVGGTGDPLWDGQVARALSPLVCELPGADHGLFVPGPLADSVANLARLTTAVEEFCDTVVWPSRTAQA